MLPEVLSRLRLPVLCAPMFLVSGPELVIAASRAGVLGSFPAPNCRTAAELDEWLTTIRAGVGDAPWALNLVTHRTNSRLADDLRLVAEHRPPIVITALGSPAPAVEIVHGYGGLVIADVIDLRLARKAAAAGVDGLGLVSAGSGGHTGHLSPLAFVPAVRSFFDGFLVVGGGVADGFGIAGGLATGADLVSVGTRFLATAESRAVPEYKQMVVDHGPDDLVISAAVTGTPASWLRPSLERHGIDPAASVARAYDSAAPASRWKDLWAAGQGLGAITEVAPTADVVDRLEAEFHAAVARFVSSAGTPTGPTVAGSTAGST
ncbi:NAD(P)H-dependent flavin oxidoreductase [Cryptosporangium phraense]|uniref:Nitronate monooxygenase n=1 Tax=Cryptosporangium phraense TaxID=2593070 RepID=A0A545AKX8_9ACTN|nr:nitronate monooxygenase [Cryptosporangium phraense]TQS41920.1 nitronate monooxygenase [Cryptosporangium phraense]